MPVEWIILIAVLLGALLLVVVLLFVCRWIKRLAWWQIEETEKAERAARIDDDTERKQPDIPVWRGKPNQQKD